MKMVWHDLYLHSVFWKQWQGRVATKTGSKTEKSNYSNYESEGKNMWLPAWLVLGQDYVCWLRNINSFQLDCLFVWMAKLPGLMLLHRSHMAIQIGKTIE